VILNTILSPTRVAMMPYLPAIDGLRAIAVVLVLLFHAKLPLVRGGFIGVDVFFVISGYLITGLILQRHAEGRFLLLDFYERRIRRIFPALFLVLFATMAFGAAIMGPPDLIRLGSSILSAALFVANFYFWKERLNYLQDNPDFEPLLHTWSLAIEEQFYLLFPIFLLALLRLYPRPGRVLFGVGLASLALSVMLSTRHPQAAFYFSVSRVWELLLGSWIAATQVRDFVPRRFIPALQLIGAAMIGVAAVSYDRLTPFPGFPALLPCFGTALLIAWSHLQSRIVVGLSNPALVWVGLISFPLYLWHLPLLVLARLYLLREPAPHEIALLYLTAVLLAAATWRFIEKPIRARKGSLPARHVFVPAIAVTFLAITVGTGLRVSQEFAVPSAEVARMLAAAKDFAPSRAACHNWDRKRPDQFADCVMGDKSQPEFDFALWGDSHAGALAEAVDAVGRDLLLKGVQLTSDDCLPVLGVDVVLDGAVTDCAARNEAAFVLLSQRHVRQVILAGAWFQYLGDYNKVLRSLGGADASLHSAAALSRQLNQTIRRLQGAGIEVVIVGPVPYIGWNVPSVLAGSTSRGMALPDGPRYGDFMAHQRHVLAILSEAEHDGVAILYPHERLCKSTCIVRLDGQVLYSDSEHLSTAGAKFLQPMFARKLDRLMRSN
jgi:peptidoglycan/LPS O-acetylase OafA/YrhL